MVHLLGLDLDFKIQSGKLICNINKALISLQVSNKFLKMVMNPENLLFSGEVHCEAALATYLFLRETRISDDAGGSAAQVTCIVLAVTRF